MSLHLLSAFLEANGLLYSIRVHGAAVFNTLMWRWYYSPSQQSYSNREREVGFASDERAHLLPGNGKQLQTLRLYLWLALMGIMCLRRRLESYLAWTNTKAWNGVHLLHEDLQATCKIA